MDPVDIAAYFVGMRCEFGGFQLISLRPDSTCRGESGMVQKSHVGEQSQQLCAVVDVLVRASTRATAMCPLI